MLRSHLGVCWGATAASQRDLYWLERVSVSKFKWRNRTAILLPMASGVSR
jgi:hypothetical protein